METEKTRLQLNELHRNMLYAAAAAVFVLLVLIINTAGGTYLAGVSPQVRAYVQNEEGSLEYVKSIPRGTRAKKTGKDAELDEVRMLEVRLPDEEDAYYVAADNLAGKGGIVQEKTAYVRTPLTVYENESGPEIASFMPKGSSMEIIETGQLMEDGTIDKYKVSYTDPAGESGAGYIYGKYVVGTQEEADANYNEHGEYDAACKAEYGFDLYGGHAKNMDYYPVNKPSFEDNELCTEARTMYINTYAAVHPEEYVKLIKKTDCNAVVIDVKDGPLTYKSEVANEISPYSYKKAYASVEDMKAGVQAYKDAGMYTIGRIVVFNDTRYAKDHPENCIKSESSRNWPSAYSRDVWEYNVKIALEAVELFGFDEIQFDYMRFPETSYFMSQEEGVDFRNKYGEEKGQAIQNFCYYACDVLHDAGVYVSADVFGECSEGYCTAYGQYWPAISNVVDVVSSMPYTDHFGNTDTWSNPYDIMYKWASDTAKCQSQIPTPAVDRTWITGYNTPYWNATVHYDESKLREQIKGLTDAGLNGGFIPWNVLSDIEKYWEYKGVWDK